jgi:hypothetical protein
VTFRITPIGYRGGSHGARPSARRQEYNNMGYGIGGILILILVILAIIYLAKRV